MPHMLHHVQQHEKTGRLSYRRRYPPELVALIGAVELKRSLKAKRLTDPGAMDRYNEAAASWASAVDLARKESLGAYHALSPELIGNLAEAWTSQTLSEHEEALWLSRPLSRKIAARDSMLADIREHLEEAQALRGLGDLDGLIALWGDGALSHARAHGLRLDCTSDAFRDYVRAFHDATVRGWEMMQRRVGGEHVPTPPMPHVTIKAHERAPSTTSAAMESFEDIAKAILDKPRHAIGPSTKQAAMTALRFFREAFGSLPPAKITKAVVSEWLDLLAARPNRLPAAERSTPIRELVARYASQDVPRLSTKTMATQLGALSALWNKAQREEGRIAEGVANPFVGRRSLVTIPPENPQELSPAELEAIFSLPIFTRGERPQGGKGEASYWIPLILLWTGARPEEIAQLLVSDIYRDPEDLEGGWVIRITDEGMHPHKGRQSLKTTKKRTGRRTFPVPQPLIDLGLPAYLEHLRARREVALFPELRTKGERNLLFAGFGEWWSGYLQEKKVLPPAEGRRASREFRHNWTTAARKCGIPEDAREYIQGHRRANASANQGYGSKSPLGEWSTKISFAGVDFTPVRAWSAAKTADAGSV